MTKPQTNKTAVIMAGGTGGHIFPGLAVAEALRSQGWAVHWLGGPDSMESQLVPAARAWARCCACLRVCWALCAKAAPYCAACSLP